MASISEWWLFRTAFRSCKQSYCCVRAASAGFVGGGGVKISVRFKPGCTHRERPLERSSESGGASGDRPDAHIESAIERKIGVLKVCVCPTASWLFDRDGCGCSCCRCARAWCSLPVESEVLVVVLVECGGTPSNGVNVVEDGIRTGPLRWSGDK